MVILCQCDWEIPGVDWLPSHQHFVDRRIRRERDGREFDIKTDWVEQDNYEVLSSEPGIRISVDWKEVARRG